ncbi:hypothetical protein HDG34_003337 [Paraburkholderia sp. HC6.4b]|uniref:hypothetical protein n=1 Tax=unclassified Paraburkholderia TaxID=2615204 RepID=UPI001608175E|nr:MULTISPECIES: hypothetical protein [unclassified Paraburkholderia]MBB5409396.1 hypothetical protein [Paraburkholderia sp. HC6.4b]MBB5451125.1 hypothetical protein [Paraburkholderia sp. Kb1A]
MKAEFVPFLAATNTQIRELEHRSRVIATAVALAVSRVVSLPSTAVEAPGTHYNFTVLSEVQRYIAVFNEEVAFDVRQALASAREFWMMRYRAAHAEAFALVDPGAGFYDNLIGVATYVDKDSCCFNNQHLVAIYTLAGQALALIRQMQLGDGHV